MMPPEDTGSEFAAAYRLALAVNSGNYAALAETLSSAVEFDTQSLLEPIFGRDLVLAYFETQAAIARAEQRPLAAELGWLPIGDAREPGLLISQGGIAQAFWTALPRAGALIERIFGYTRVPPPDQAECPGRRPGTATPEAGTPPAFAPPEQQAAFRAMAGPVRFHGFCVSEHVATTWLRPRLDELARLFPGSETYLHIHDSIGAAPAQLSAFASQTTRFDLAGYPAICVERGGKVFRGGRAVQSLPALIDDLNALLGGRAGGPRST